MDEIKHKRSQDGIESSRSSQSSSIGPDVTPTIYPGREAKEEDIGISPVSKPASQKTPETQNGISTLARILTAHSTASSIIDPGPPPDGGLTAWTQAAMGHIVVCNTWGFISSFGVFQTYYAQTLGHPPSDISWVGSFQIFLLFFIGTLSGRATDAGLFHRVYFAGYVLQILGIFMTSLSKTYWQLFLAQGICLGLGNGLQFCPTVSLVSTYFTKNRSFAIGIAATGSATGGLIYPVLVQQLLPKIGFGWTMRVLGFVTIVMGALAGCLLKTRLSPRKSGPIVEWAAFKELPYVLYCSGMFAIFMALYFAFYYVGLFGREVIGVPYSDSVNLLLIMNGVGYPGRIIPNFMADRYFGPLNTLIPFGFGSAILLFAWSGVKDRGGLIAFAAVYGLFAAGIQSMFPAVLASLTDDLKRAGVRMGMCFSVVSLGALTGAPIAGALIQATGGSYLAAQMWAGSIMMVGVLLLVGARICKGGYTIMKKV